MTLTELEKIIAYINAEGAVKKKEALVCVNCMPNALTVMKQMANALKYIEQSVLDDMEMPGWKGSQSKIRELCRNSIDSFRAFEQEVMGGIIMDMDDFALGLGFGLFIMLIACALVQQMSQPNITDEELYRFCIVRKIELKDCVIPPFPLEKKP